MAKKKVFMRCGKCDKKLIERLPNGLFKFIFGRGAPVQLFIFGSVKIRCFRKKVIEVDKETGLPTKYEECGHWNIFNFFPGKTTVEEFHDNNNSISGDNETTEVLAKSKK